MENSSNAPSLKDSSISEEISGRIKELNLDLNIENLILIELDKRQNCRKVTLLSEGSKDNVFVDLRKIFGMICQDKETDSFILAHNHPDGKCSFSQSDLDIAFRIARISEWMNCMMIDFIVFTDEERLSIKDYDKIHPLDQRILDFQIATAFMDEALNLSNPFLKRFVQGCRNIRCTQPSSDVRRPDCGEINLPLWNKLTGNLYYADPLNKDLRKAYEKCFDELKLK